MDKKYNLRTIVVIVITIGISLVILYSIDTSLLINTLLKVNLSYLALSLVLLAVSLVFWVIRWQIILKSMGHIMPFGKAFNVMMAALPLTSVTPSKSGDLIRALYLKDEIAPTKVMGSVLTERLFDVIVLMVFFSAGSIVYGRYEYLMLIAIVSLLLILVLLSVKIFIYRGNSNIIRKGENLLHSLRSLLNDQKSLSAVILITGIYWLLGMLQATLIIYSLKIDAPPLFTLMNLPIAIFIGMLPVTIGGMGTRDVALMYLFSDYGMPEQILGAGILYSVLRYWLLSLIGLLFMRKFIR